MSIVFFLIRLFQVSKSIDENKNYVIVRQRTLFVPWRLFPSISFSPQRGDGKIEK